MICHLETRDCVLHISSSTLVQSIINIAQRTVIIVLLVGRLFLFQRDKWKGEKGTPIRKHLQESGLEMMDYGSGNGNS